MSIKTMIDNALAQYKQNLWTIAENIEAGDLTPESTGQLSRDLLEASTDASQIFLRGYLESKDVNTDVIERNGQRYRFKGVSGREVITFIGPGPP